MFFKKKKGEKAELPVHEQIKLNTARKRRQLTAMYIVGLIGGMSWMFVYFQGSEIFNELTQSKKITVHAAASQMIETEKVVSEEEVWKIGEFSAYTASSDETDASPLVMASGKMVYVGAIACPRTMDFGQRIEVRGVGVYTCEDRMNARYGDGHFDIFMTTKSEALQFGRQNIEWREA